VTTALLLPLVVASSGHLSAAAILAVPAIVLTPSIRDRFHSEYGSFFGGLALLAGYSFWFAVAVAVAASNSPAEPDHRTWLENQHKKFGLITN
jgi:hypothetical protein